MADPAVEVEIEYLPVAETDEPIGGSLPAIDSAPAASAVRPQHTAESALEAIQSLNRIRDLDTLLEQVLFQARFLLRADAGTIYLKAKNRLFFSYVQNDTLFAGDSTESRYVYSAQSLDISRSSVAGYVASTGDTLLIDDVYDLPPTVEYEFNPAFDRKSNYKTGSMLIVPLETRDSVVVGVLQLINAKDNKGRTVPFSGRDRLFATQFAQHAADAIERAKMSREMVLRMVELSAMRDPYETGEHAKRVGAFSVELYDAWAKQCGFGDMQIRETREIIRTAAMLHDVGKVGISDAILRKSGALTEADKKRMRLHTILGARLFRRLDSPWDRMAHEVALNHHERWDGTGYPGRIENVFAKKIKIGSPKRGEEIPLAARIVAIADVYDALASKRAYKDAWEEDDVMDYLAFQAGKQFDPQLVEVFRSLHDIMLSIRERYPSEP